MKKGIFLSILLGLFFSCSQDPIFAAIESEIALREFSVANYVYSVVEFDGKYYAAHKALSSKPSSSQDEWDRISLPDANGVMDLAVGDNGEYLYVRTLTGTVFYRQKGSSSWTEVEGQPTGTTVLRLIGTGKKAFAVLKGTKKGAHALTAGAMDSSPVSGTDENTVKCAGDGTVKFSSSHALAYNPDNDKFYEGSQITGKVSSCAEAHYYYNGQGKYILVGSSNGNLNRIVLDEDGEITGKVLQNDIANEATTIAVDNIFRGGVWVFGSTIFVATYNSEDSPRNGLWGYYKSRGTWNKE